MIYAQANASRLAWARIAIFGVWFADIAAEPFPEVAALPVAWFTPLGPFLLVPESLLHALWDAHALSALKLATLGSIALALIGAPLPRVWAGLSAVLLLVVTSFVRGFGHADHSQLQLLFVTFALTLLPAWDVLTIQSSRRTGARNAAVYPSSFAALALVFAFPYFMTGIYRLTHEGAAIFFGNSMLHFIARDTLMLDHFDFTLGLSLLDPAWRPVLNAGFALVTVAELAAPFIHLRRGLTGGWLLVILPFHLLAPVIMHVLFAHNLALLLLLYAWPACWGLGRRRPTAS